jgi:hypothetical protein
VRLNRPSVPVRVEYDHDQANWSTVSRGEELALSPIPPVLILEVQEQSIDLDDEDLGWPEQAQVDRLAVVSRPHLGLDMP